MSFRIRKRVKWWQIWNWVDLESEISGGLEPFCGLIQSDLPVQIDPIFSNFCWSSSKFYFSWFLSESVRSLIFCWSWSDTRFHFAWSGTDWFLSIDPWSFRHHWWLLLKLSSKSCCFLYSLSTDIFRQTIWSLSETNLSSHFLTWKNLKVFQRWQN